MFFFFFFRRFEPFKQTINMQKQEPDTERRDSHKNSINGDGGGGGRFWVSALSRISKTV